MNQGLIHCNLISWLITFLCCTSAIVGSFKATGIQISNHTRLRGSGHGGGAQMNLFDRFARVVRVSKLSKNYLIFVTFLFLNSFS